MGSTQAKPLPPPSPPPAGPGPEKGEKGTSPTGILDPNWHQQKADALKLQIDAQMQTEIPDDSIKRRLKEEYSPTRFISFKMSLCINIIYINILILLSFTIQIFCSFFPFSLRISLFPSFFVRLVPLYVVHPQFYQDNQLLFYSNEWP